MLLVVGDNVRIAIAADVERQAAVGHFAVGDDHALVADDEAGAVIDFSFRRRSALRA